MFEHFLQKYLRFDLERSPSPVKPKTRGIDAVFTNPSRTAVLLMQASMILASC